MSVIDMAEYLDVHRSTCSRWMNDHGAPPKPIYVRAWAERTGVDHDWLVTGIVPDDRRPDDEYAPRDSNPEPAD
ncbi:MAG: helix-turn-helix domain-containing protein, partial [Acidimicrobiales bacterium]